MIFLGVQWFKFIFSYSLHDIMSKLYHSDTWVGVPLGHLGMSGRGTHMGRMALLMKTCCINCYTLHGKLLKLCSNVSMVGVLSECHSNFRSKVPHGPYGPFDENMLYVSSPIKYMVQCWNNGATEV